MMDSSQAVMAAIDKLPREWREMVHEYGWVVVNMRLDGHKDAGKLRALLEDWRLRRQEDWLSEIPYRRT